MRKLSVVLFLLSIIATPVLANFIRNSGFETAGTASDLAENWEWDAPDQHGSYWGSATRTNWRAHADSWEGALRGIWAGAGANGGVWQEASASPGANYEASAWFWADATWSSTEQGIKLEFYDADYGSPLLTATNSFADVGETWVRKYIRCVAPAGAVWVRPVVWADGAGASGALQFDAVELRRVPLPGSVFAFR